MKNLKHVVLTTMIVLCSSMSFAQKHIKDSLSVKIDDNIEVKMSIYDHTDLKETVEKDLKQLQDILKENPNMPQDGPYMVLYEPYKKLTIKPAEKTETIIYENGEYSPYAFSNRCEVNTETYRMYIDFNNLDLVISENLMTKMSEALDKMAENESRYSKLFNYQFNNDELAQTETDIIGNSTDYLQIKSGVGANVIKNTLVLDFTGKVGFAFGKKGIIKNEYYVSYNLLYDFIDNSSPDLNGFLNIGYSHNFSNDPEDDAWLGLEFGYLINQEGDLFDDNTFRFGLSWDAGNSITISPQVYFSSEQTYPGLRIGFGF